MPLSAPQLLRNLLVPAVLLAGDGTPVRGQSTTSSAQPLGANLISQWKNAGATVGWMANEDFERLQFSVENDLGKDAIPAFSIENLKLDSLAGLSPPETAFALDLDGSQITDQVLKKLVDISPSASDIYL